MGELTLDKPFIWYIVWDEFDRAFLVNVVQFRPGELKQEDF